MAIARSSPHRIGGGAKRVPNCEDTYARNKPAGVQVGDRSISWNRSLRSPSATFLRGGPDEGSARRRANMEDDEAPPTTRSPRTLTRTRPPTARRRPTARMPTSSRRRRPSRRSPTSRCSRGASRRRSSTRPPRATSRLVARFLDPGETVKSLPIDVNSVDSARLTPLMWAVRNRHAGVLAPAAQRARPRPRPARPVGAHLALHWCVWERCYKFCACCAARRGHEPARPHRRTPLCCAADAGDTTALRIPLDARGHRRGRLRGAHAALPRDRRSARRASSAPRRRSRSCSRAART